MKSHPFADYFPMMSDAEFESLCGDIATNGLRDPIITFHDCILDGRNREAACRKTHVKPRYEEYKGTDPVGFVISKNLHRRHLDETGRAFVAASLVTACKSITSPLLNGQNVSIDTKVTVEEASKAMNISVPSVNRALKIEKDGSDLLKEAAKSGEVSLAKGASIAAKPKGTQTKVLNARLDKPTAVITDERKSIAAYNLVLTSLDKLTHEQLIDVGVKVADLLGV